MRISTHRSFISATDPGRRAVAIRTFSIAVSELNRLCCWKMKPMFLRSSTRALSLASERFRLEHVEAPLLHPPQRPDEREQGRLAGARGPRHDHDLAAADLQIVVEEHLGPGLPGTVRVVHADGANHHVGPGGLLARPRRSTSKRCRCRSSHDLPGDGTPSQVNSCAGSTDRSLRAA